MKIFLLRRLAAAALLLGALAVMHSETSPTQTQRFPQFDNEDVKVWKSVVMPNAPLTMHRHEHPRVIIALSGGTMKIGTSRESPKNTCGRPARPIGSPPTRPTPCMPT
jgi:hypothetical protein